MHISHRHAHYYSLAKAQKAARHRSKGDASSYKRDKKNKKTPAPLDEAALKLEKEKTERMEDKYKPKSKRHQKKKDELAASELKPVANLKSTKTSKDIGKILADNKVKTHDDDENILRQYLEIPKDESDEKFEEDLAQAAMEEDDKEARLKQFKSEKEILGSKLAKKLFKSKASEKPFQLPAKAIDSTSIFTEKPKPTTNKETESRDTKESRKGMQEAKARQDRLKEFSKELHKGEM